jgi:hypothetical protein
MTALGTPAFGAPVLSFTAAALNLGSATVGGGLSGSQQWTITNASPFLVAISALPITGSGAGSFAVNGVSLPIQLATKTSVSFTISFTPVSAGSLTASMGVAATTSGKTVTASSVSLSGIGVTLTMGVGNGSLAYGSVLVDLPTASTQTATLTNTGTGNLTVSGIAISGGGGAYSATTFPPIPFALAPNQSAEVSVQFDPTAGGTATGTVSLVSNATNSPSVISFTGTGAHWVSLSWTASVSLDIIFYNVYEGTVSGGPYYRFGSLMGTTYEDSESGLTAGSTHYYVVTAVDNTGLESLYSSQATAKIPTP